MTKNLPSNTVFHISIYQNWQPWSGATQDRKHYYIQNISTTLQAIITQCPSKYEVALHSDIVCDNKKYHLPQMDFAMLSTDITQDVRAYLSDYLTSINLHRTHIFLSGRSFHAYSETMLSEAERYRFLWYLLTAFPQQNTARIFDTRRIGHSLKQWNSALRLTQNTNAYKGLPQYYKTI